MGRKPTKNLNVPPRLRARRKPSGKTYYYYDSGGTPRREIPLGPDYALAVKRWAELEINAAQRHQSIITFRYVAERYQREVLPMKAPRTQRDNQAELAKLYLFFDAPPAPLSEIEPIHIRQYMDWRCDAKIRANREKSLFSHIWNKAREWGYTDRPNPCQGVRGYKERGRKVYVEESIYRAVYDQADQPLRDAMDLAYLTGQRPADVLRLRETDLRDGALSVEQGKTGQRLRISVAGELAALVERILERKRSHQVRSLALVASETGQPLSKFALRTRFDKARAAAKEKAAQVLSQAKTTAEKTEIAAIIEAVGEFQFRDLRAKAGTDKAEAVGIRQAQKQLGHQTLSMTEHYIRNRRGDKVDPTR